MLRRVNLALGAPPDSGVSGDQTQNNSMGTPARQPVNTACVALGWNVEVHTPETGVEQVLSLHVEDSSLLSLNRREDSSLLCFK